VEGAVAPTTVAVRKLQCLGYLTVKTGIAINASVVYKLYPLKHSLDGSTTHVSSPLEPPFR